MSYTVSYTTVTQILQTLSALGSISTLNNSLLLLHAGQAEALINAKIAKRYTLPLTQSVPILETLATDIAIYNVLTTRISLKTEVGQHPWFQRFKMALDTLDDIVNGDVVLVGTQGTIVEDRSDLTEMYSTTMTYKPTTYEGPVELQDKDPDKVKDNLDARDLGSITDRVI